MLHGGQDRRPEEEGAHARVEAVASLNGPRFYGLGPNERRVTLRREEWTLPDRVGNVVVFRGGDEARWRLA